MFSCYSFEVTSKMGVVKIGLCKGEYLKAIVLRTVVDISMMGIEIVIPQHHQQFVLLKLIDWKLAFFTR